MLQVKDLCRARLQDVILNFSLDFFSSELWVDVHHVSPVGDCNGPTECDGKLQNWRGEIIQTIQYYNSLISDQYALLWYSLTVAKRPQ